MHLVQLGGFEPPTSCSTDRRSNQLSYNCIFYEALKGAPRMGRKLGATPGFGKAGTMAARPAFSRKKPGPDGPGFRYSLLNTKKNQAAGL